MKHCLPIGISLFLAACATDTPPEPMGPLMPAVETQPVNLPVPARCGAAEKLGPEPQYAATAEALRAVPHPGPWETLTDRQKLENWLHVTKLQTIEINQRAARQRDTIAVVSAC